MRYPFGRFANALLLILFVAAGCGGQRAGDESDLTLGDTVATAPDSIVHGSALPGTAEKLNVNTASTEEFRTIPNIGDRMVHEFEEYRPYVSIRQFRREIGKYVDEEQIAKYEEHIYVPIDPNDSDRETLMQVPGLDESEAASLIEGRPFASEDDFLQALSEYVSQEELETAERYLDRS